MGRSGKSMDGWGRKIEKICGGLKSAFGYYFCSSSSSSFSMLTL